MIDDLRKSPWLIVGLMAMLPLTALGVVNDHYQTILIVFYGVAALAVLASEWPERYMAAAVLLLLFPFTWSPTLGPFGGVLPGTVFPPFVLMALPAGLTAFATVGLSGHLRMR